jgi:hypothetical protein
MSGGMCTCSTRKRLVAARLFVKSHKQQLLVYDFHIRPSKHSVPRAGLHSLVFASTWNDSITLLRRHRFVRSHVKVALSYGTPPRNRVIHQQATTAAGACKPSASVSASRSAYLKSTCTLTIHQKNCTSRYLHRFPSALSLEHANSSCK